jgi:LysR family hca operon transcriptional activator
MTCPVTKAARQNPSYVENLMPSSVVSRPLAGDVPTIDLVIGYNKANHSPILRLFLSHLNELIARLEGTVLGSTRSK